MDSIEETVRRAIQKCLNNVGVPISNCNYGVYSCGDFVVKGPGVYVFFDEEKIYYVGEANNIARRVLNEHCRAHIGGSEGVVRFLMYFLDEVCNNKGKWSKRDAKGREKAVRKFLRGRIRKLRVFALTCVELANPSGSRKKNVKRKNLEDCLKEELRPELQ